MVLSILVSQNIWILFTHIYKAVYYACFDKWQKRVLDPKMSFGLYWFRKIVSLKKIMILFCTFYHHPFRLVSKSRSQIFERVTYPFLQNQS